MESERNILELINDIIDLSKSQLIRYTNNIQTRQLESLLTRLDKLYYNTGNTLVEDWKYDIIRSEMVRRKPDFMSIGSTIRTGEKKVELPYWMGSLDKIKVSREDMTGKQRDELSDWVANNPADGYMISEKLDGVSCLFIRLSGTIKLYTRGDGRTGSDITHLLKYISGFPGSGDDITVRGELILTKKDFLTLSGEYRSARNTVSGIINSKTFREHIYLVKFIAYELISPGEIQLTPSEQYQLLQNSGFFVIQHRLYPSVNIHELIRILREFKNESRFEIDGIVIQPNLEYIRNESSNPTYSIAFKMDTVVTTEVISVEWNISRYGFLKPTVKVKPVDVIGATINYANGFNGKFIQDNRIGPGAIVEIGRSGDVIPHIYGVVRGADEPDMPRIPYHWSKTDVDLIADDAMDICVSVISNFFSSIGAEHIGEMIVKKLIDNGFDTVYKIISAHERDFLRIPGLRERGAKRLYESIHHSLQNLDMIDFLSGSSLLGFGVGKTKLNSIFHKVPDVLERVRNGDPYLVEDISNVRGISEKTSESVITGIGLSLDFLDMIGRYINVKQPQKAETTELSGGVFVFSDFRDQELTRLIQSKGGRVADNISKAVTGLIIKDSGTNTIKVKKATQYKIPIFTREDFLKYTQQ